MRDINGAQSGHESEDNDDNSLIIGEDEGNNLHDDSRMLRRRDDRTSTAGSLGRCSDMDWDGGFLPWKDRETMLSR